MFHDDHHPAHFHAEYGEFKVRIRLDTLEALEPGFPPRALRLVREWADLHRDELSVNWQKARASQSLDTIEPLP
jgi:hypothetical protein